MLKIIYEALQKLKLEAFERWLHEDNTEDIMLESPELLELINAPKPLSFNAAIESPECIIQLLLHFDQSIYCEHGTMALF